MLGLIGAVVSAGALAWAVLRLKSRDRVVLGVALAMTLALLITLHFAERRASRREKALNEACRVLAMDLRDDVKEFERLGRQTDPFAQLNLLNFRNGYLRTSLERRVVAELCVDTIRECFPMTLGNDTKQQALSAADALENHTACRK